MAAISAAPPFMLADSSLLVSQPSSCPANKRASTTLPFPCFQSLPTIKFCNSLLLITIQNARGGGSPHSSSSFPYILPSSVCSKSCVFTLFKKLPGCSYFIPNSEPAKHHDAPRALRGLCDLFVRNIRYRSRTICYRSARSNLSARMNPSKFQPLVTGQNRLCYTGRVLRKSAS